jgi:hypothetical protein
MENRKSTAAMKRNRELVERIGKQLETEFKKHPDGFPKHFKPCKDQKENLEGEG